MGKHARCAELLAQQPCGAPCRVPGSLAAPFGLLSLRRFPRQGRAAVLRQGFRSHGCQRHGGNYRFEYSCAVRTGQVAFAIGAVSALALSA